MAAAVRRIWLVGMMGSGKSTVGAALAGRLGWVALDTDAVVEARAGKPIAALWREQGEPAFRAFEVGAIAEASATAEPTVISVGGGAVLDPANRARMSGSGSVVWLQAAVPTLVTRIGTGASRPALGDDPLSAVAGVDEARRPHYRQLADMVVQVDELTPDEIAEIIAATLRPADVAEPEGPASPPSDTSAATSVAGRRVHA
jgi:shikimate kinase